MRVFGFGCFQCVSSEPACGGTLRFALQRLGHRPGRERAFAGHGGYQEDGPGLWRREHGATSTRAGPEAARRSPRCPRQRLACCRTTSRDCTRRDGGRHWSAPRLVTPRGARQLSATVRRCKMCSSRQTSRRSSCGATSRSAPVRPACTVTSGTVRSRLHARLPHQGAPLARTHTFCPPHTRTLPQTRRCRALLRWGRRSQARRLGVLSYHPRSSATRPTSPARVLRATGSPRRLELRSDRSLLTRQAAARTAASRSCTPVATTFPRR